MRNRNDFDKYQSDAHTFLLKGQMRCHFSPEQIYCLLGFSEEVGEVCGLIAKIMRDSGGYLTPEKKEQLAKELGDAQWMLSQIAKLFDIDLSDIADGNLAKLQDRFERGVINGNGDNR